MFALGFFAAGATFAAACDETALVLEVRSPRPVPGEIDRVCLSAAALAARGDAGAFGRRYALSSVPQTLTVLPGDYGAVRVWARGERNGIEVARAGAEVSVEGGAITRIPLDLPGCPGGALVPRLAGQVTAPPGAKVVVALGWRAPLIVAVGAGGGARFRADGQGLGAVAGGVPAWPGAAPAVLLAFDADGDCDDDLLIAGAGSPAALWRHDGDGGFAEIADAGLGGLGGVVAGAAADVDDDGDVDLVLASPVVALYRNDGSGRFSADAAAIPSGAVLGVTDPTALALGDVSGDGHADLVIGQGSASAAPRRVAVNDAAGTGTFAAAPGLLPDLAERTRALVIGDADGDGDLDLVSAGVGAAVRLYVNRGDGRLEDRSFVRLPTVAAVDVGAGGVGLADLDGDCLADLAVARQDGSATIWRGTGTASFAAVDVAASGTGLAFGDTDGDGVRDLVLAAASSIVRVAPR